MAALPLTLGPLRADGHMIHRSGVRWLVESGRPVRAGQVIGYCNLSLDPVATRLGDPSPWAEEKELQIAFAPRMSGRVRFGVAERGGYLSLHGIDPWDPDTVLCRIEPDEDVADRADALHLRLLGLAGRRMTGLADVHAGLLPGWHARTRGWWCDQGDTPLTLLSLGICDATGVVIGDQSAFFEMCEQATGAAQMVFVPDHPVAPAAPVLLDQMSRSPARFAAIAADVRTAMTSARIDPGADDWMFAGALLSAMKRNPIADRYALFTPAGTMTAGPADAVLLSLNAEPRTILRHRTLGYRLHVMRHHQAAAGPAARAWLANAFEPVRRSIDDIKADYEALIDRMARETGARAIILNSMSTSGHEDISNYAAFDAPLSDTLANVASKEMNLMLEDIAETRDLRIVDVDAIAADLGGAEHLPDGIHQSGPMQSAIRGEILHIMQDLREQPKAAALR